MATTINADTVVGGAIVTGDASGQLGLQAAGTTVATLTSTSMTITKDVTLNAQSDLRFADSDSSNYVALQAPATVTSNVTFTLPSADGTSGQVIQTNGSGVLSFATPASTGINYQTFTSSGTWTKPSGYSASSRVLIQAWGAGGSGGRGNKSGGGGGGGYTERWLTLSSMGATETITIGAGGAAVTADSTAGNSGGNSTVGSLVTAYGGGGGQQSSVQFAGGGGGSPYAAGANGSFSGTKWGRLGGGGTRNGYATATVTVLNEGSSGINSSAYTNDATNIWGGGGGGGGYDDGCTGFQFPAGFAVYGGGGGGASDRTLTAGQSIRGGNGGAGNDGSAAATAGTAPAGGGGASRNGFNSGAGARGEVWITVFPA